MLLLRPLLLLITLTLCNAIRPMDIENLYITQATTPNMNMMALASIVNVDMTSKVTLPRHAFWNSLNHQHKAIIGLITQQSTLAQNHVINLTNEEMDISNTASTPTTNRPSFSINAITISDTPAHTQTDTAHNQIVYTQPLQEMFKKARSNSSVLKTNNTGLYCCRYGCNRSFSSGKGRSAHESTIHRSTKHSDTKYGSTSTVRPYKCRKGCSKHFKKPEHRNYHEYSVHCTLGAFDCNNCFAKLSNKDSLAEHKQTYHTGGIHVCYICQSTYEHLYKLKEHMYNKHVPEQNQE